MKFYIALHLENRPLRGDSKRKAIFFILYIYLKFSDMGDALEEIHFYSIAASLQGQLNKI